MLILIQSTAGNIVRRALESKQQSLSNNESEV